MPSEGLLGGDQQPRFVVGRTVGEVVGWIVLAAFIKLGGRR